MKKSFLLLLILFVIFSCNKEQILQPEPPVPCIPEDALVSPENEFSTNYATVWFHWKVGECPSSSTDYIEIDNDSLFAAPIGYVYPQYAYTHASINLNDPGTYFWRLTVKLKDNSFIHSPYRIIHRY